MSKKKKINPRFRPATQADVNKAKRQATSIATEACWAIMFTALRDKYGWGAVRLGRLWQRTNEISQSIVEGYVDVNDLITALREESGIVLK